MTFNLRTTLTLSRTMKLIAAAAMAALPVVARAQSTSSAYDYSREIDPAAQVAASSPSSLDRDRNDLIDARHRADDLAAQRDRQQRVVDSIIHPSAPAVGSVTITPTGDVKALQQQFDDAKAQADKIHADAVARFEATEAWKSQYARFDQSRKDLKGPTDDVLNQLSQTQDFKDLVAAAREAKEHADKLHADKSADPKAVKEADDAFMAADNRVQEMAEKSLQADPKVADGRKRVDEAQARLHDLRDNFEKDLINDAAFGPAVAEVKARQDALDAATGHGQPQLAAGVDVPANTPNGDSLRDAQAKLDNINHDLDQARAEVDRLTAQVRQDEQGVAANNAPPAYQPQQQDPGYQQQAPAYPPTAAYGGYEYPAPAYGYAPEPAPLAIYSPAVAYDAYDWWSPGLSFGFSFGSYGYHDRGYGDWYDRWCRPYGGYGYGGYRDRGYGDRYSYGYGGRDYGRGYYGGARYGGSNRYGYGDYSSGSRYGGNHYGSYSGRSSYDPGYQDRVNRRYDYAAAGHQAFEDRNLRRDRYAAADYAGYRDRTTRREDYALADRSAYESRVQRRAAESQSLSRNAPTYQRSNRVDTGDARSSGSYYSGSRYGGSNRSSTSGASSGRSSTYQGSAGGRSAYVGSSYGGYQPGSASRAARQSAARQTPTYSRAQRSEASSSSRSAYTGRDAHGGSGFSRESDRSSSSPHDSSRSSGSSRSGRSR